MPDVTTSNGKSFDFIEFFGIFIFIRSFMPKLLYLHQTFIDFVSNECTHFSKTTSKGTEKLTFVISLVFRLSNRSSLKGSTSKLNDVDTLLFRHFTLFIFKHIPSDM